MALHAVAEGDPGLIPLVERTRFVNCVEPRAANCTREARFCMRWIFASVLLTASPDFARGPCSELRNPCARENSSSSTGAFVPGQVLRED